MVVAFFVLACSSDPKATAPPTPVPEAPANSFALTQEAVPGFPDFRASSEQQLQLDQLPATWKLPEPKLGPKLEGLTDEFVLEATELPNPKGAARELKVVKAPLPFPVDLDEQMFKPEGMLVSLKGEPVPFGRGPAPLAKRSTWRIHGKNIVLSVPEIPAVGELKVRYPGVREALDRHDPAKSGLAPEAFAAYDMTIGGTTRHGLMLVAPTVAEWDVTVPSTSATFEAWLALELAPLERPKSDGAAVTLTVFADGRETVVDEQLLNEPPPGGAGFRQWRADLTPWAGKAVKLKLVADPRGTPLFDWVFVGSPTVFGPPKTDNRRVVVIALDTTRPDHLSFFGYDKPTTPEVDSWAKTGIAFDRTWSTAPRTRPSFRSSTTGRLPLEAVGATNIGQVFAQHGFATAGLVANPHLQPRFSFDDGFDLWSFDGNANAQDQVDRSLAWLEANQQLDTYLFVHFMDPHMVYQPPKEFRDRFITDPEVELPPRIGRSEVLERMRTGTLDDRQKKRLVELHDAELAYLSSQLGRLFDALDRMPGRTLVVLHSDHGEEFWEHQGFEHNHSLYDEVTRAVMVFRPRGGLPEGQRFTQPATLMDIAPTLYDLFGFADAPKTDGRSLVPLLAGSETWEDRPLPVGYLQYSHERWGVVWNDHKYQLHTGTGREELYDLKADPQEARDLSESRDLEPYRARLREAHGIPVGPGWRIRFELPPKSETMTIELPVPATMADILDPEAIVEHRANVEWGELPKRIASDIGNVNLSSDKKTLTFGPGRYPEGVLYVMFDAAVDPAGVKVSIGGKPVTLTDAKRGRLWKDGTTQVLVEPGTIVVPPVSEASRMGIGAQDEMQMLEDLGYIERSDDDPPEPPADDDAAARTDQSG